MIQMGKGKCSRMNYSLGPILWVHLDVKKESSLHDDRKSIAYFRQSAWVSDNGDGAFFEYFPYSP